MHELSLAVALVEELEKVLERENGNRVVSITVIMGKLSGVEREPFEFAFPIAAEETKIEGAKLIIEESPIIVKCNRCQHETTLHVPFAKCENCNSRDVKYISGKEFLIKNMEIE